MCHQRSSRKRIIGKIRVRLWRPDSNPELSGNPGAVHCGEFPYIYLDGVVLKRSWAGEVRNISVLIAIGVGTDGFRQILGVAEGEKEDLEGWRGFLRHLKDRGLKGHD